MALFLYSWAHSSSFATQTCACRVWNVPYLCHLCEKWHFPHTPHIWQISTQGWVLLCRTIKDHKEQNKAIWLSSNIYNIQVNTRLYINLLKFGWVTDWLTSSVIVFISQNISNRIHYELVPSATTQQIAMHLEQNTNW